MPMISKPVLAGAAVLALGGAAIAAAPAGKNLRIAFPDGSLDEVRHSGDLPPRILLVDRPPPVVRVVRDDRTGRIDRVGRIARVDRIVRIDRIVPAMHRRMAAVTLQAGARAPAPDDAGAPALATATLPPGTISYSFVSTSVGGKTCARSVRVTAGGAGEAPKVERQVSGDCAAAPQAKLPSRAEPSPQARPSSQGAAAPAAVPASDTI